jgi:hypothetical protein
LNIVRWTAGTIEGERFEVNRDEKNRKFFVIVKNFDTEERLFKS